MVKIKVNYDTQEELAEVIKLLAPRMNYCTKPRVAAQNIAYIGIETGDIMALLATENAGEPSETEDFSGDTPIDCTKGGIIDECDR